MDILGSIGSFLGSGLSGGLTGLIGTGISAFFKYKTQKQIYEHEEKLRQFELEKMKLQAELQIKLNESKVKGELQIIDSEIYKESIKQADKQYFSEDYFGDLPSPIKSFLGIVFGILDVIRGLIRPMITVYSLWFLTWIGYNTYMADPKAFVSSAPLIVQTGLYLSTTITAWWFGNRDIEKFINRLMGKKNSGV